MPRNGNGRKKTTIARMPNQSKHDITFSKRLSGLFKKASELRNLCRCDIAILVVSPSQEVFSFGEPSVENVLTRVGLFNGLTPEAPADKIQSQIQQVLNDHQKAKMQDLNVELQHVTNGLELEKDWGRALGECMGARSYQGSYWWDRLCEDLSREELHHMWAAFQEVMNKCVTHVQALTPAPGVSMTNNMQLLNPSDQGYGAPWPSESTGDIPIDGPPRVPLPNHGFVNPVAADGSVQFALPQHFLPLQAFVNPDASRGLVPYGHAPGYMTPGMFNRNDEARAFGSHSYVDARNKGKAPMWDGFDVDNHGHGHSHDKGFF